MHPEYTKVSFLFFYLGSWEEAIEDLEATGLLDERFVGNMDNELFLIPDNGKLVENYEVKCQPGTHCSDLGKYQGLEITEYNSYAELFGYTICMGMSTQGHFWTHSGGNLCEDFEIDDEKYCTDAAPYSLMSRVPKTCNDPDVLQAFLEKAADISSFVNNVGPSVEILRTAKAQQYTQVGPDASVAELYEGWHKIFNAQQDGWFLQRLDDEVFAKLVNSTQLMAHHLFHGASQTVDVDSAAMPWRNMAFLMQSTAMDKSSVRIIYETLVEAGYQPQGYYAYLNSYGMKNWRSFYFNKHWRKLQKIRGKYDPLDVFGKPMTIESIPAEFHEENE